jgi:hypothetical protein
MFGPHARLVDASFFIELKEDIALLTDLVIRSGTTVRMTRSKNASTWNSNPTGNTSAEDTVRIRVGLHQVRIEAGGRLEMEGLTITDSVETSALVVMGSASVTDCIFCSCNTTSNLILSGAVYEVMVPTSDGSFFGAVGGAVLISVAGMMEIADSAFLDCHAHQAKLAVAGGAVFVGPAAQLSVARSEFRRNAVINPSTFASCGGALAVFSGGRLTMEDCTLTENKAAGGLQMTAAGAVFGLLGASIKIVRSVLCDNAVTAASGGSSVGGAVSATFASNIDASHCLFCRNSVAASTAVGTLGGGAINVGTRAKINVVDCVFREIGWSPEANRSEGRCGFSK